jgi:hypothetical protein
MRGPKFRLHECCARRDEGSAARVLFALAHRPPIGQCSPTSPKEPSPTSRNQKTLDYAESTSRLSDSEEQDHEPLRRVRQTQLFRDPVSSMSPDRGSPKPFRRDTGHRILSNGCVRRGKHQVRPKTIESGHLLIAPVIGRLDQDRRRRTCRRPPRRTLWEDRRTTRQCGAWAVARQRASPHDASHPDAAFKGCTSR